MNTMIAERVSSTDVLPLRAKVLRDGPDPATCAHAGDEHPNAGHFAVRNEAGVIIGIATVHDDTVAELPPVRTDHANSTDAPTAARWRIRGMAVDPDVQARGLGRILVEACLNHGRSINEQASEAVGAGAVWCNARTGAKGFYARLGFATNGEEFDIAGIGPHYVMSRKF